MSWSILRLHQFTPNLGLDHFLEAQGFETYLPSVKIRKNGNYKVVPFFSCYLFVRVDPSNGLSSLRSIPGSTAIVGLGGEPATVLEDGISMMKGRWPT